MTSRPRVLVSAANSDILFFFKATPTTEIYTLSLHDALPIRPKSYGSSTIGVKKSAVWISATSSVRRDRKSTRLNSSHRTISYAAFCLKNKNSVIVHGLDDSERKNAYGCDITYGTNNEYGFDYLRDNTMYRIDFFLQIRQPQSTTLFPDTTLFR